MPNRSWLFVPGDSERKLAKAASCGADAIIIDLEDAVAEHAKPAARLNAAQWLAAHRQQVVSGQPMARWVRINALGTPHWRADLAAVMAAGPDGIVLPKAAAPEQLQLLAAEIYELEQRNGVPAGATRILPQLAETPESALAIRSYAETPQPRLAGLTWGAEDLMLAAGATRQRDATGEWTDLFRFVRVQLLLVARARGLEPVDTLYADFADLAGLQRAAEAARADGFSGMLAIHPDQVPVINRAFTVDEAEQAEAEAIVDAFAQAEGAGVVQVQGRMMDQPHLKKAKIMLGRLA